MNIVGTLRKTRRHQTKGLMSKIMVAQLRYKSLCISLSSSAK